MSCSSALSSVLHAFTINHFFLHMHGLEIMEIWVEFKTYLGLTFPLVLSFWSCHISLVEEAALIPLPERQWVCIGNLDTILPPWWLCPMGKVVKIGEFVPWKLLAPNLSYPPKFTFFSGSYFSLFCFEVSCYLQKNTQNKIENNNSGTSIRSSIGWGFNCTHCSFLVSLNSSF